MRERVEAGGNILRKKRGNFAILYGRLLLAAPYSPGPLHETEFKNDTGCLFIFYFVKSSYHSIFSMLQSCFYLKSLYWDGFSCLR